MHLLRFTIYLLLFSLCTHAQQSPSIKETVERYQKIENDTARIDSLYNYSRDVLSYSPKEEINIGKIILEDAERISYQTGIAYGYAVMAEGYEYLADYPQSLKYYLDAYKLQKDLNMYTAQINTCLGIARIYDVTGDSKLEKQYVREAMDICDKHSDNERVRRKRKVIMDYLAITYKKEGKYDTAISIFKEAIELARKDRDVAQEVNLLCNYAITLKSNKNYQESLDAYNHALSLIDTVNDYYSYAVISGNMSILFYDMGDLKKSEQYALRAIALEKKFGNTGLLRDAYETLRKIYEKEKRFDLALEYSMKWSAIKDSILNQEKSAQIKELQTKYDTEDKDRQIKAQTAQLAYNRNVNLFLGLISVLLVAIIALIYQYQKKRKHYIEERTLQMKRQLELKERDNEIYRLKNVELKQSNEEIALRNIQIEDEKVKSELLLLNILPEETANELREKGYASSHKYELATVMFADIVGFTRISSELKAEEVVERIDHYFKAFDNITLKHGLEKIKTIGDSYMCAGGLPKENTTNPVDVVNAALDMIRFVQSDESKHYFNVRIGIHSGPLVSGIVGRHKFQYDIWGDTVNVAARVEETSDPGRINISGFTYELVKDRFKCEYRGKINARNKGEMDMYFVTGKL